jgi:hypothetical protein
MTGPSPYWAFLTGSLTQLLMSGQHQVVVTDRAILVVDISKLTGKPKRLGGRHPRNVRLGTMSGLFGSFELNGRKYWVHKRFHKDVASADAPLTKTVSAR